jgi:hypothetical protein
MTIFQQVLAIPKGTKIEPNYTIKGLGQSRGERALVYFVPSKTGARDSQKRVRESEWELSYQALSKGSHFTRQWFDTNLRDAAKDGTCSFRFIGETLVLLGLAARVDGSHDSYYVSVP